jgi:hypothetical protein
MNSDRHNPAGETAIERVVMRRVRLIRILALVVSTAALAALTALAALWSIGREVWVARVLENMPKGGEGGAYVSFWVSAFLNTQPIVQVLTVLTFVSLVFLVWEAARFLFSPAADRA